MVLRDSELPRGVKDATHLGSGFQSHQLSPSALRVSTLCVAGLDPVASRRSRHPRSTPFLAEALVLPLPLSPKYETAITHGVDGGWGAASSGAALEHLAVASPALRDVSQRDSVLWRMRLDVRFGGDGRQEQEGMSQSD
ncbi:hypothetical protein C8F01DRAFT_1087431 [Mycena amicta]|nr:hypothetical protein C8F01DRAFT_1087431 [Mycena amicta]